MRSNRFFSLFACLVLVAFLGVGPPGCATEDEVQRERAIAVEKKADLDAAKDRADAEADALDPRLDSLHDERERVEGELAAIPIGTPARSAAEAALASVVDRIGKIEATLVEARRLAGEADRASADLGRRIAEADAVLAAGVEADNPGTVIGSIAGSLIPGAAVLAPFLGGLIYRGARLAKAKAILTREVGAKTTAIEKIVGSIDVLAKIAPEVKAAITRNAETIDAIQTPAVKAEVDAAQIRFNAPATAPVA